MVICNLSSAAICLVDQARGVVRLRQGMAEDGMGEDRAVSSDSFAPPLVWPRIELTPSGQVPLDQQLPVEGAF